MRIRITTAIFLLLWLITVGVMGQNVAGFWLGVTYPANPNLAVYNYTMSLTQTGSTIGGTAQTANPDVPFGGVAYLSGQVLPGSKVRFSEADKNGSTQVKDVCFWRGELTYDPVNESLTGTYESIVNNVTCTDAAGGKVELYRIVLKSGNKFCKGTPVNLVVTGKDIRWYSSANRSGLLARGNTFSPTLSRTTTFYITQTLYQTESPAVPVRIEITEPTINATVTNASCGQASGSITAAATDSISGWQYSLNGGAFQPTSAFSSLSPGSYTVTAKATNGCRAERTVTVTSESGPTITRLNVTPPRCQSATGEITVVATGGTGDISFSLDGIAYQASPQFGNVPAGSYTVRLRDEKGCAGTPGTVVVPSARPLTMLNASATPTTCGQRNGQATLVVAGGSKPVQYSLDGQSWWASNTFETLAAGSYTISARDSAGCTASQSVSIAASTGPPTTTVRVTPEACGQQNGVVSLTFDGVTRPADMSLDGRSFGQADSLAGLSAGTYALVMKDDRNCVATQSVVIPPDCANLVHVPDAFSPNNDQVNDVLRAYFRFSSLTVSRFIVYDRWGAVLYNRANFALNNGEPIWDGQVGGQQAPAGTYLYRLDCQFPNGTQTTFRQSVVLLN